MSIFSRAKKAVKRIGRKLGPTLTGGLWDPQSKSTQANREEPVDVGQRAAAAKRLAEIQKQAGGGQIKYNTEEEVQ
jgi:hypothetical protein